MASITWNKEAGGFHEVNESGVEERKGARM